MSVTLFATDANGATREGWLRAAWDVAADAMVMSDAHGTVISANAAYFALYGYPPEQVLGHSFAIIFPESQREWAAAQYALAFAADPVPEAFESTIQRADGAERIVETRISFLMHGSRRVAMLSTIRDVTERKQAEAHARATLMLRVDERTAELVAMNDRLTAEIEHREATEARLRALSARLEEAREEERLRLSRELHDQLGGALTGLKMDLGRLRRQASLAPDLTTPLAEAIDDTVHLVRRLATELRPTVLDDLGVVAALEWQLKEFEARSGLACDLSVPDETIVLAPDTALALFRVFQECLTNIVRHAQASRVCVAVHTEAGRVRLDIRDDGRGFGTTPLSERESLGLLGMRERLRQVGGTFTIDGSPRDGTSVRVTVPAEVIGKAQ